MRILLLNYEYPPLGGGAGTATFYLLKELSRQADIEIDLITSSVNTYREEQLYGRIKGYFLDIGKRNQSLHYQTNRDLITYACKCFFFSRKLIKNKQYDFCHAFFGIPCGFVAMNLRIPYIVSLRGSDVPFYNIRFATLDELVFSKLSRYIWRRARAITAVSRSLADMAKQVSSNIDISVIYNGINTAEFYPHSDILNKEPTFNIIFIGRLIERKGLEFLLAAFLRLVAKYPFLKLLIVGDGPMKENYERFVNEYGIDKNTVFYGKVGHSKVRDLLQQSHIFVLPSINEALGNAVLEAMACGLPIISTDTGAAELIHGNGLIVSKRKSKLIEQALEKLINDQSLRKEMAAKSRTLSEGMIWANTAKQYLEIYKTIK